MSPSSLAFHSMSAPPLVCNLRSYWLFLVRGFEARLLSPAVCSSAVWLDWDARQICVGACKHGAAPRFTFPLIHARLSICPSHARALVIRGATAEPRCALLMADAPTARRMVAYWKQWRVAGHPKLLPDEGWTQPSVSCRALAYQRL